MRLTRREFLGSLTALLSAPLAGCIMDQPESNELVATVFQAGKADAILLQQGDAAILIDAGLEENAADLLSSIRALGTRSLDALIITHFDKDHVGGADTILENMSVRRVFQTNSTRDSEDYDEFIAVLQKLGITPTTVGSQNTMMTLGAASVMINGPAEEEYDKDPSNNSSLITTVKLGKTTFLLMGDAENARIKEFIASFTRPEGMLALKVPYHGHTQGQLDELIEAVQPDIAVITNGPEEPDASELTKVKAMLEEAGAQVLATTAGDITLTFDGTDIVASQ